jgi:hypothetical protein
MRIISGLSNFPFSTLKETVPSVPGTLGGKGDRRSERIKLVKKARETARRKIMGSFFQI